MRHFKGTLRIFAIGFLWLAVWGSKAQTPVPVSITLPAITVNVPQAACPSGNYSVTSSGTLQTGLIITVTCQGSPVNPLVLKVPTATINALVGKSLNTEIASVSGGVAPYTVTLSPGAPSWVKLSMNGVGVILNGTPVVAGNFPVNFTVFDSSKTSITLNGDTINAAK